MMEDAVPTRLRWRCRRGMLELDLLLLTFLERDYPALSFSEKRAFERLLQVPDTTLLGYLQGCQNPPDEELMNIVIKII